MSFEVIGVPSLHLAAGLRCQVTVNCGLVFNPPLASDGISVTSGDATKLLFGSSSASRGRTWMGTSHCSHDEFAHCVIGLRQSGHCSAAMTRLPPALPAVVVGLVVPLLPLLLLLPHAAATTAIATTAIPNRAPTLRFVLKF